MDLGISLTYQFAYSYLSPSLNYRHSDLAVSASGLHALKEDALLLGFNMASFLTSGLLKILHTPPPYTYTHWEAFSELAF